MLLIVTLIDCVVSEWGPWNECDEPCGPGTASRNRTVQKKARNGGKHCPALLQNRRCQGTDCHATSHRLALLQETALLLPVAASSSSRLENDTTKGDGDIIPRLQNQQDTFHAHKPRDGYCIAFLIMKVTKQCHKDPSYRALLEGDRIVVHCDLEQPPFTKNITSVDRDPNSNYISDESAEDEDGNENTSIDDNDRNFQHHSARKDPQWTLPDRCLGEGLTGRNTRFASLLVPSCHGKWLRLSTTAPKKCTFGEAQFIFV